MEFVSDHPDVFIYLVLALIEQVFLLTPGTWPYRLGVPVRFKPLDLLLEEAIAKLAGSKVQLHYNVDESRKEICFRNVFPLWTWGPMFFTGQAQFDGRSKIIIRMAPLTSLGVIYLFLDAIGTFQFHGIATAIIMALLLAGYYRWLAVKLDVLL